MQKPTQGVFILTNMTKPTVEIGRWDEKGRGPAADGSGRPSASANAPVANLEALAWLLDNSIPVPGLRYRIGLESLLGLLPVVGDAIGALISSYILILAAKMGVPRVTLLRMGYNVTVEAVIGLIPFAGDIFDFAWKANTRNVALLRAHVENPTQARRGDWVFAALFILGVLGLLGLFGWAAFALGSAIRGWIAG